MARSFKALLNQDMFNILSYGTQLERESTSTLTAPITHRDDECVCITINQLVPRPLLSPSVVLVPLSDGSFVNESVHRAGSSR